MSSQYTTPVLMVNVAGLMVGPMRIVGMGIGSLSCAGRGDPGSDHGEMDSTLLMGKWEDRGCEEVVTTEETEGFSQVLGCLNISLRIAVRFRS